MCAELGNWVRKRIVKFIGIKYFCFVESLCVMYLSIKIVFYFYVVYIFMGDCGLVQRDEICGTTGKKGEKTCR